MPRYRKVNNQPQVAIPVLGMLYIVEVKMYKRSTGEKTKQKLLLVGCQESDIESKLRWILDASLYDSFNIERVDKVREKVHVLSTVIKQDKSEPDVVVDRDGRSESVYQGVNPRRQFGVGISTTITADDENAALRKLGHALINDQTMLSNTGASLPASTTIIVEEVAGKSGYSAPRDVSLEKNRASFVRG